jgi:hypothetical protein
VDVHIWDVLPDYVVGDGVDTTVDITAGEVFKITVTATLSADTPLGSTITNTAYYSSGELSGESNVSFTLFALHKIYLPLLSR